MSKKNVESFIPKVIEILDVHFPDGIIPSAYNGYIASFGTSIVQSGLKPTLALFENRNASNKEDKSYLTKLILNVLDEHHNNDSLLRYVLT